MWLSSNLLELRNYNSDYKLQIPFLLKKDVMEKYAKLLSLNPYRLENKGNYYYYHHHHHHYWIWDGVK